METSLHDTNILIDHVRDGATSLEGYTTILNLIEFPKAVTLQGLDIILPGKDDYDKGFELSLLLLEAGTPIPAIDIVLAAVAINRNLVLQTRDQHFEYVRKINQEFQVRIK
ncbi:type II toxin-antitoxin system VapC family toxin [Candidatus Thorarchaeota archaeon]|nr:MAG: type II toxin-antitoxin system VapC family toxin [Candidatus Thorarchaeota archaeon]